MSTYLLREARMLWLLILMIVAAGVSAFIIVPRMEDPTLTERAAIVNTRLPGADAERVESLVTDELLDALRAFEEIKELRSSSRPGISTVGIVLKDEITDVDEIWARIRDKLSDARPRLSQSATPPDLKIIAARAFSYILAVSWVGDDEPVYSQLRRWTSETEDVMRSLSNTENVERFGDPAEEVRVEVHQDRISQLGITVSQLAQQLAQSDSKVAAGKIHSSRSDLLLEVAGEFDSLDRIKRVVLRSSTDGQTAYLSDVAEVKKTIVDPPQSLTIVGGKRSIVIGAMANPKTRLDLWTPELEAKLNAFKSRLPPTIQLTTMFRQGDYVDARMKSLLSDLTVSAVTVVLIVFFMMGWRSALIVGSALPLAACMVFTALRFLEIPFHQMSLSGLVIALGMLEGAAIIIVDEVQRKIRGGNSKIDAVKHSISHMFLPLFGASATTVISFMPIAMMPGPSGEFVGTIGTSVILAIVAAFGLALTIIPTLSALTTPRHLSDPTFLENGFSNQFLSRWYERSLRVALRRPLMTAIVGFIVCMPGFLLLPKFAIQFFPGADRNQFPIEIELSAQASLKQTEDVARRIRSLLIAKPEVEHVDWVLGESAPSFYYNMIGRIKDSPRYGQAVVTVKSSVDVTRFINETQRMLDAEITDAQVRVRQLEQGPPFNAPIEVQIFGSDSQKLREIGEQTRQVLSQHDDVTSTQADLTDQLPKIVMQVREEEARLAGIELSEIARQLDAAIEGRTGGSLLDGSEELPVRVRLAEHERSDLTSIGAIELLPETPGIGKRSPKTLSSLASMELTTEPALVSRLNDQQMNEVRGYLRAGVLPSKVLKRFKEQLTLGAIELPPGYEIKFGGEASKRGEAIGQLMSKVTLLVAATIFVLVLSLRSFRASGIILLVAICSCGMAFIALYLSGFPLGFTAIVGSMGMVGVAINDSMVVLSELRQERLARHGDLDAVVELVMRSSRHVLSTTFTVGCSFIPMIVSGGTFWPPMAMVVVGGVFGATLIALYWIPAVHRLMPLHD